MNMIPTTAAASSDRAYTCKRHTTAAAITRKFKGRKEQRSASTNAIGNFASFSMYPSFELITRNVTKARMNFNTGTIKLSYLPYMFFKNSLISNSFVITVFFPFFPVDRESADVSDY